MVSLTNIALPILMAISAPLGIEWSAIQPGNPLPPSRVSIPQAAFGKYWTMVSVRDIWQSNDGVNWEHAPSQIPGVAASDTSQLISDTTKIGYVSDSSSEFGGVYTLENEVNWTKYSYPWSEIIISSSYIFFHGNFTRIGGFGNGSPAGSRRKVWTSADSINWIVTNDATPWANRRQPGLAILGNELFLIGGGLDSGSLYNDVWSTEDAATWEQATAAAPWAGRYQHSCAGFKGKLWMSGGYNVNDASYFGDEWSSADGATWERVEHNQRRMQRAGHAMYVVGDRLVITGGLIKGTFLDDTWTSADGQHWEQADTAIPWENRSGFGMAVMGDAIYLTGGEGPTGMLSDAWRSTDGTHWQQLAETTPWAARRGHSLVAHNGALYLCGGSDRTVQYDDVWRSTDGVTWNEIQQAAPWGGRYFHGGVSHAGRLWVIGGTGGGGPARSDVWASDDGITWEQMTAQAPWGIRAGIGCVSHRGKLWVIAGGWQDNSRDAYTNDVWSSADGVNWTKTAAGKFPARINPAALSFGGRIWMLGGAGVGRNEEGDPNNYLNDVWTSFDGTTWTQLLLHTPFVKRRAHAFATLGGKLFVMGGQFDNFATQYFHDVWVSEGSLGEHSADPDKDFLISLSELLRLIQFYNSDGFSCAPGTEDGYAPGPGDTACAPHALDYSLNDWHISLSELLRLIQFYNFNGYHACPDDPESEDGFCPGA
jgi:N-acetylneuraminic acid mutarotase